LQAVRETAPARRMSRLTVTAMLAWFDEPPDLLEQAVDSVACVADRVVAVDGGYELAPGAKPGSPKAQADRIRKAARAAGLDLVLMEPAALWKGQVAKRHFMLRLACQESDWVMPLDADWCVFGNREQVREELARSRAEALTVEFSTPENDERPLAESAAERWHQQTAGRIYRYPLIFRVLPDMSMDLSHWGYSALRPGTGDRIAYWDRRVASKKARTAELTSDLLIEHLCLFRDEKQILRNREFCAARDQQVRRQGAEA
jgi:hypothetical protein